MKAQGKMAKPNMVPAKRGQKTEGSASRASSKTRNSSKSRASSKTRGAAKAEASASQPSTITDDSVRSGGANDIDLEAKLPNATKAGKKGKKPMNKRKQDGTMGEAARAKEGPVLRVSAEDTTIISEETSSTRSAKRGKVKKTRKATGAGQPPLKKAKLNSSESFDTLDSESEEMKERRSKEGAGMYVPPQARHSTDEGAAVPRRASKGCCDEDDQQFQDSLKKLEINGETKSSNVSVEDDESKVVDQGRRKPSQLKVPNKKANMRKVTTGGKAVWDEYKKNQRQVITGNQAAWDEHKKQQDRPYPHNNWESVQPLPSPSGSEKGRVIAGEDTDFGLRNTQNRGGRSRPSMDSRSQKNEQFEEMKQRAGKLYSLSDVKWIDSHCHLDFIFGKVARGNYMKHFEEWMRSSQYGPFFPATFEGCIPNFIHPELFTPKLVDDETLTDLEWIKTQVKSKYVYGATYGCHPHKASLYNDKLHQQLIMICKNKDIFKTVAIGECGLDYFRMRSPVKDQINAFKAQLQLVKEFELPLVIHCRPSQNTTDTEDECLRIMKEVGLSRFQNVHRHCYTGNLATAQKWVNAFPNTYFGFTNTIVSFSAEQLEAVSWISLDRILLETDAPYFRPKIFDCGDNDKTAFPGMAIATAKAVAELRQVSLDEVLKATRRNVDRCYAYSTI